MNSLYACAFLTAFTLVASSAIGAPKPPPSPKPASATPRPVTVSALKSLLLDTNDLPFDADLTKEIIGSEAGKLRGTAFWDPRVSLTAGRAWAWHHTSTSPVTQEGASVIVALASSATEAERVARAEATRYAGIFYQMAKASPLARFASAAWYHEDSGKSLKGHKSPTGFVLDALDEHETVSRACIVFCRANVAVRIDLDRGDGFHPSELLALGARVARRIDAAAKAATPAPVPRRP